MNKYIQDQLKAAVKSELGVKLDMGCGDVKEDGFIGIDKEAIKIVDIVMDIEETPYKEIPSECASLILASHLVEHLKPWKMIDIMNEWWRILKPEGQLMIATPYAGSPMFWQDPTHVKGWIEVTPDYFDPFGKLSNGKLFHVYHPMPWDVKKNTWDMSGTLEVLMVKRPDDKKYHECHLVERPR